LDDNHFYQATGFSYVLLKFITRQTLLILNILFVSGLAKNLLLVAEITKSGTILIIFKHDQCIIKTKSSNSSLPMTYHIKKQDNLYPLGIAIEIFDSSNLATNSLKSNTYTLMWHFFLWTS